MTQAIETPHRRLMASAGSGKTYRLVLRAIELLHAGEPVDAIVASTFTRAAAGEIRDRILARLCEAAASDRGAARLHEDLVRHRTLPWGSPHPIDRARALELLAGAAREIHRLQVRTLDGLFAAIVQAFPAELGVAPGARILDEAGELRLRGETVEALLADEARAADVVRLLRTLTQGEADSGVDRLIDATVAGAWGVWRESAGPDAWRRPNVPDGPDDAAVDGAVAELERLGRGDAYATKHWRDWIAALPGRVAAGEWAELTRRGPVKNLIAGTGKYGHRDFGDDVLGPLGVLRDRARAELLRMHAERTWATAELCARYGAHHAELKRTQGRLAFDDLAQLLSGGVPADLDRVAWRLDGRIHHLLLDEFQDTSTGQWRVLEPMAARLVEDASGQERRSLFVVGDVKQSIYAWRSGRPEILEGLRTRLLPGAEDFIEDEPLACSWRSSPVVLEAVNRIFGDLPRNPALADDEECRGAAARWHDGWRAHQAAERDGPPLPGVVELRTGRDRPDVDSRSARSAHEREALAAAARRVIDWHRAMPTASIGVLVRRRDAAARILESLKRADPPVDAIGPGGRPLVDEPAVTAVLSLMHLADHPGDLAAAFHVAESPLGAVVGLDAAAMRDPEQRRRAATEASARTRDRIARDGLAGTIGELTRRLAPHCDASQLGRVRHLLEIAAEREAELGPRPSELVAVARSLRAPEAGAGTVSVMTFHASKGLEFDLVVATDLAGTLHGRDTFLVDRDPADGAVRRVSTWVSQNDRWVLEPEEQEAYVRVGTAAARESLCMLYVAATRARHGLSLVVPAPFVGKNGETFPAGRLHGVLRGGLLAADAVPDPDAVAWSSGGEDAVARFIAERDAAAADASPPAADDAAGGPAASAAASEPLRLSPAPPRRPRPTAAAAAAEAAEATTPLAVRLRPADREPRDRGTAIHALLEAVAWVDVAPGPPGEAEAVAIVRRAVPRRPEAWAREQAATLPEILGRPPIRGLLELGDRDPDRVEADVERPWVRADADGVQQGLIDRVEIERDAAGRATGARIVDWKTDPLGPEADAEEVRRHLERYGPQIATYRRVVAEATGLDPARVEAVLAFVTTGLVLPVPAGPAVAAGPGTAPAAAERRGDPAARAGD